MNGWLEYLPFCESDRQREVVTLRAQGVTVQSLSETFGVHKRNILMMCQRIKARAAKQGYSPEHDMIHTVPDNFSVSGTSTLYKDGAPLMQWVKSKNDTIAMFEQSLEHFKEGLLEDVQGKATPIERPAWKNEDLMACYMIGDHHLGQLYWPDETLDDPLRCGYFLQNAF